MLSIFFQGFRLGALIISFLDVLTWQFTPYVYYTEYSGFCKGYLFLV